MGTVILRGFIEVPADDLVRVEAELAEHIRLTQGEPGCLTFEVVQASSNPCRFEVYEAFSDRAAFEHHQARVKRSKWGEVTENVARHYQITTTDDPRAICRMNAAGDSNDSGDQ